jgi:hypothetical protein
MNYRKIYDALMERGRNRKFVKGEHERHHIVPKALGGGNERENIAVLTYREHFLAHWILTKITEGQSNFKMIHALNRLMNKNSKQTKSYTSWQYSITRQIYVASLTKTMVGSGNPFFGRKHTDAYKEKARARNAGPNSTWFGKPKSEEWKKAASKRRKAQNALRVGPKHPMFGRKQSIKTSISVAFSNVLRYVNYWGA